MFEKKELDFDELENVSGGSGEELVTLKGTLKYKELGNVQSLAKTISLQVPASCVENGYLTYVVQYCNENNYLFESFTPIKDEVITTRQIVATRK